MAEQVQGDVVLQIFSTLPDCSVFKCTYVVGLDEEKLNCELRVTNTDSKPWDFQVEIREQVVCVDVLMFAGCTSHLLCCLQHRQVRGHSKTLNKLKFAHPTIAGSWSVQGIRAFEQNGQTAFQDQGSLRGPGLNRLDSSRSGES